LQLRASQSEKVAIRHAPFAVILPLIIEVGEQQLVNVRFAPIADKNRPPHETLRVPEA
jgi:hypothetical protein